MTKLKAATATPANTFKLEQHANDDPVEVLARAVLGQNLRHGLVAAAYAGKAISGSGEELDLTACAKVIQQRGADAIGGKLAFASAMLASQAVTLDCMFAEFARRAALNMGEYPDATERYARLAMKAQSNSRSTLEALARMHQPREQTMRHVHVDNRGGQAVIAETLQTGGMQNAVSDDQCLATGAAGACAALPCPDALRGEMSGSSREGAEKVQDARRDESGRA